MPKLTIAVIATALATTTDAADVLYADASQSVSFFYSVTQGPTVLARDSQSDSHDDATGWMGKVAGATDLNDPAFFVSASSSLYSQFHSNGFSFLSTTTVENGATVPGIAFTGGARAEYRMTFTLTENTFFKAEFSSSLPGSVTPGTQNHLLITSMDGTQVYLDKDGLGPVVSSGSFEAGDYRVSFVGTVTEGTSSALGFISFSTVPEPAETVALTAISLMGWWIMRGRGLGERGMNGSSASGRGRLRRTFTGINDVGPRETG